MRPHHRHFRHPPFHHHLGHHHHLHHGRRRSSLQRRIFAWFGATILLTGATVAVVMHLLGQGDSWRRDMTNVRSFLADRFAKVWDDPAARDELAEAMAKHLETQVFLSDGARRPLGVSFPPGAEGCGRRAIVAPVERAGAIVGHVSVCFGPRGSGVPRILVPLLVAGVVLWAVSSLVARKLSRPLRELARVANDIGEGRLSSRVRPHRHDPDEVGRVAASINHMADRIERMLADQRELLAAVSHEIRTPLSRIRLLTEMAKSGGLSEKALSDLDREVVEIDALVGELLASSRVDFGVLSIREVDAVEAAVRALERGGIPPERLEVEGDGPRTLRADPTLLARALANLIDNAKRHAGGVEALLLRLGSRDVTFDLLDSGPGLPAGEEARIFERFFSRSGDRQPSSLGLGLSLVKRIAEAHGGSVRASNRREGGASVGIVLLRDPPAARES